MSLKVIGAGCGRTGTESLKTALEILYGAPCYHMFEVMKNDTHVPIWHEAARGNPVDWDKLFEGYVTGVDWPVAAYWKELSAKYPDALILLSVRDPEKWWTSASETIFPSIMKPDEEGRPRRLMIREMLKNHFTDQLTNKEACIAAFNAHNDEVRRTIPAHRLLEWSPGDGWEPICRALNLPIPEEPFPHANAKAAFQQRMNVAPAS